MHSRAAQGIIPTELVLLKAVLKNLDLNGNCLTGTLPSELSQLSILTYMDFSANSIRSVRDELFFFGARQPCLIAHAFSNLHMLLSKKCAISADA